MWPWKPSIQAFLVFKHNTLQPVPFLQRARLPFCPKNVQLIQIYRPEQIPLRQRSSVGVHGVHAVPCHTTRRNSRWCHPSFLQRTTSVLRRRKVAHSTMRIHISPSRCLRHSPVTLDPAGIKRENVSNMTFISM